MTSSTILILGGAGAVALFIGVIVAILPGSDSMLHSRLKHLEDLVPLGPQAEEKPERDMVEQLRHGVQTVIGARFERTERGNKLADRLARADIKLRPTEWVIIRLGVAAVVGAMVLLRFQAMIAFVPGAVAGYLGAELFLRYRQSKRVAAFNKQLSPAIQQISSSIKAGYTFAQAIDLVAKNTPAPMGSELGRVVREVQLGLPMGEALNRMVRRNDSEDLRLMLIAVQIQQQVGGNLAQVLDTIEFTVRERIRIKGEIKALTGQARASGWVLIILPFAMTGILAMVAPTYFDPMFHKTAGFVLFGIAFVMIVLGYGVIRKIVNVKV
ncbi:MAG TPA: type II secretion system F family protein [Candidatus Binatia bacterium]|nr:type II secretion system F family protein [Candidatus Binatia bacterium]